MIGEVARDFDLYTKITGGQRIDLFGARMEELPAIWRRLVDAGFESGHAYGKSLRTVKSCVGLDLVPLRRAGLRRPRDRRWSCATAGCAARTSSRAGSAGCARECAEARGKDFGVIATEKGWNLYVGGNGGADPGPRPAAGRRPRHRDPGLATSTASSCTTSAPPTGCSAPPPGSTRSTAASTGSARSSSTTRSASAPSWRRRWRATSASYVDEWRATLEDPDKLAPLRVVRQRARTPRTRTSRSPTSAARSARGRRGPVVARRGDPGGGARDERRPESQPAPDRGLPGRRDRGRGRRDRAGATARRSRSSGPTTEASTRCPTTTRSRGRRCWRAASSARRGDVPFVASPMHKQAFDLRTGQLPRRRGGPGADVRRAVVDDGRVHVGRPQAGAA